MSEQVLHRIQNLRRHRGLTQESLAVRLGVAANTVSRWETGKYELSVADLERIGEVLDVPVHTFFTPIRTFTEHADLRYLSELAATMEPDDVALLCKVAQALAKQQMEVQS